MPFNQPGFAANTLLSGAFVTPVELEAVEAPEALQAADDTAPSDAAEPAAVAGEPA